MSHSSRPSSPTGIISDAVETTEPIPQKRRTKVEEFIGFLKKVSHREKKLPSTPKPKTESIKKLKNFGRRKKAPIDDRKGDLCNAVREHAELPVIDAENNLDHDALAILTPETNFNSLTPLESAGEQEPPLNAHHYVRRPAKMEVPEPPKPGELFEKLLNAGEGGHKPHPNGFSGMTYAIAAIISRCLVRNKVENPAYNEASPYLDLAPLYGPNDRALDLIRLNDGSGKLAPDAFYEDTNDILFTPAMAVLLILLNRYHNSIAETLLSKNEGGTWHDLSFFFEDTVVVNDDIDIQDNEIFEIARSLTCIQFKNIVMEDFLKGLLGVSHVGGRIKFNLLADSPGVKKLGSELKSSIESSLLYNWFGLMSSDDINHVSTTLRDRIPHKAINEITMDDVRRAEAIIRVDTDRTRRDVAGLRRNEDGFFNDADLARVLHTATETQAGMPCSNNVAACLQAWQLELLQQSRNWKICTLNEYRGSLGLKALASFAEWNPDPTVYKPAEELYRNIEYLELYPGLQGECGISGTGFQLGHTMSFGLSGDLISRVRSDPRFTTDYNENKLTRWGYKDSEERRSQNGAFGAMLPQVLFRTLPLYFPFASVYSLFPMLVPSQSQALLETRVPNSEQLYDFKKPLIQEEPIIRLTAEDAVMEVLSRHDVFASPYAGDLQTITDGYGYILGFDDPELHDKDLMLTMCSLLPDKGALSRYQRYYRQNLAQILTDLCEEKQTSGDPSQSNLPKTKTIDLVQDLISVVCMRWVCDHLCGSGDFINIKKMSPEELRDVFQQLNGLYAFASGMIDPSLAWEARENAVRAIQRLKEQIDRKLPPLADRGTGTLEASREWFNGKWQKWGRIYTELFDKQGRQVQPEVQTFLHRIFRLSTSIKIDELLFTIPHLQKMRTQMVDRHRRDPPYKLTSVISHVMASRVQAHVDDDIDRIRMISNVCGLVILATSKLTQVASLAVSVYLHEDHRIEREEIIRLCKKEVAEGLVDLERRSLLGYIQEAQRLYQNLSVCRIATRDHRLETAQGPIHIAGGTRIQLGLTEMHRSISLAIDPLREQPLSLQGMGLHKCPALGKPAKGKPGFLDTVLPEIFISIFSLDDIRRTKTETIAMNQSDISGPHYSKIPVPLVPLSIAAEFRVKPDDKPFAKLRHVRDRLITAVSLREDATRKGWNPRQLRTVQLLSNLGVDVQFGFKAIVVIFALVILWKLLPIVLGTPIYMVRWAFVTPLSIFRAILSFFFSLVWPKVYVPRVHLNAPVQAKNVECPHPIEMIHPWVLESFNLTLSGTPTPIRYVLDLPKAHRLSVIDVDKQDTIMRILVDDEVRGLTRDFELDKNADCGNENFRECLKTHSAGSVVIEKGKHSVTIEYAGKEFLDREAYTVDWAGEKQRRIFWRKELCGA